MNIEHKKYRPLNIAPTPVPQVRENIFAMIHAERLEQINRGYYHENLGSGKWTELLVEELGEVAKANNDHLPTQEVVAELIQLVALCVAWLEVIE